MLLTCVPPCGASPTDLVPNNTGPSKSRIVAVTPLSLGLYRPMFVRASPLTSPGSTASARAADGGSPGTNIPTNPPPAAGERN